MTRRSCHLRLSFVCVTIGTSYELAPLRGVIHAGSAPSETLQVGFYLARSELDDMLPRSIPKPSGYAMKRAPSLKLGHLCWIGTFLKTSFAPRTSGAPPTAAPLPPPTIIPMVAPPPIEPWVPVP